MSDRLIHPITVAVMFIVAVGAGTVMNERARKTEAASMPGKRAELVLVPKANLPTVPGSWTFAPEVPPPITRREQRRVVVNWAIKESQAEVAPGVIYDDFWGFEGRVPGPMLRVREGDLVEMHLRNELTSKHSHNIDFHFVLGPGGGAAALNVAPGEAAVLEARAMIPGFYMFHCATPDIPTHVANGMYGFVLVEPLEGLPAVGKELYVVQSEVYTRDDKPGHKSFAMDRAERMDPQYVVFNGAVGSLLKDRAPQAAENQTVRLYIGNAGPNLISSFHVIGQIFDKVYREGDLLSPPAQALQTTLIPAGGSAVVEFTPRVPGTFLLVDHAIFRLHRGAVGSLVVSGNEQAEIFEPRTERNKMEMTADAHLGQGSPREANQPSSLPGAIQANRSAGGDVAPSSAISGAPAKPTEKPAIVNILPKSGIYRKGPIRDFGPKVLIVKAGTTVVWRNTDVGMPHSVRGVHGEFLSPMIQPGDTYSVRFDHRGEIHYTCTPHPWMKGAIIVR